jgi:hypothetical protein
MMLGAFFPAEGYRPLDFAPLDALELETQGINTAFIPSAALRSLAMGTGWFPVVRSLGFNPGTAVGVHYDDGSLLIALTERLA